MLPGLRNLAELLHPKYVQADLKIQSTMGPPKDPFSLL